MVNLHVEFVQAMRTVLRQRRWTAAVALTIAVGVGANTTIFATVRSILLRPLPYSSPEDLVMVWQGSRTAASPPRGLATGTHVLTWKEHAVFQDLAAVDSWHNSVGGRVDIVGAEGVERLRASLATVNLFRVLGVTPTLGRTFEENEENVVLLSHDLWQRHFAENPNVVGQSIQITAGRGDRTARSFTIVGVMPADFQFTYPQGTDLWMPLSWAGVRQRSQVLAFTVVARRSSGVPIQQLQAAMMSVSAQLGQRMGGAYAQSIVRLETMHDYVIGPARGPLTLISVVSIFLLVIASMNVANLLFARNVARKRELILRLALGARRSQIGAQLGAEAIFMAGIGGLFGIVLASLVHPIVAGLIPSTFPRGSDVTMDGPVIVSAIGLALTIAVVAGIGPILRATRIPLESALREGGFSTAGPRAARWRRVMIAAQMSIVVIVLVGAGLLLRTFLNLQRVDVGFNPEHLVGVQVALTGDRYRTDVNKRLFDARLLSEVKKLPGVRFATVATELPFGHTPSIRVPFIPAHRGDRVLVSERHADPDYFQTLHIPFLEGRGFLASDASDSMPVVVVSETLARLEFDNDSAVGRTLRLPLGGRPPVDVRIIGVAADVKDTRIDEPALPTYYILRQQAVAVGAALLVKTTEDAPEVHRAVQDRIREIDPTLPILATENLEDTIRASIADRRFYTIGSVAFASVGLILAAIGLYGVAARSVSERSRELGIRQALGATPAELLTLVLVQSLRPVLWGVASGLLFVVWLSQLTKRFLFQVSPVDFSTYAAASIIIIAAAAAACLIPAIRASRQDPLRVLREAQ